MSTSTGERTTPNVFKVFAVLAVTAAITFGFFTGTSHADDGAPKGNVVVIGGVATDGTHNIVQVFMVEGIEYSMYVGLGTSELCPGRDYLEIDLLPHDVNMPSRPGDLPGTRNDIYRFRFTMCAESAVQALDLVHGFWKQFTLTIPTLQLEHYKPVDAQLTGAIIFALIDYERKVMDLDYSVQLLSTAHYERPRFTVVIPF